MRSAARLVFTPLLLTLLTSPLLAQESGEDPAASLSKGEIARAVDEYLDAMEPLREPSAWDRLAVRLGLYGDMRLRAETSFRLPDEPARSRMRLRLRLGADYQATDELVVGARLVTGSRTDSRSSHITLGDGFEELEFTLDRAYATWRPNSWQPFWLTAGKFAPPFATNPVYGELAWDADVQPEGVLFGWRSEQTGFVESVELLAGEYVLLEQALAEESYATVVQLAGRARLSATVRGGLALGYTFYADPTPDGAGDLLDKNNGNATEDTSGDGTPDAFVSDFGILDLIGDLTLDFQGAPLTFSAELLENPRAKVSEDSGWALGFAWGRAARAGDWRLFYQFQRVERDAVFSVFAQDDFLFATNHVSHMLGLNHQLGDGVGLNLWALISHPEDPLPGESTDDQWRVRLDLNLKF